MKTKHFPRSRTQNTAVLDFDTSSFIIRLVSSHFNLRPADLEGRSRRWEYVWPRWVCIYLISHYTKYSSATIGALFDRDHVSVLCARKGVEAQIETNPQSLKELSGFDTLVSSWCSVHRPDRANSPIHG